MEHPDGTFQQCLDLVGCARLLDGEYSTKRVQRSGTGETTAWHPAPVGLMQSWGGQCPAIRDGRNRGAQLCHFRARQKVWPRAIIPAQRIPAAP